VYNICCKIVGVEPGADPETIKQAYRKAAKELHPDVNASEKAQEYFVLLKNAYDYLIQHPYTHEEAMEITRRYHQRKRAEDMHRSAVRSKVRQKEYTLWEVLRKSTMARIVYIVLNLLFILIGVWLVFHSVYDLFFHTPDEHVDILSAYFSLIFGFFFGIALTGVFVVMGINYLQNR